MNDENLKFVQEQIGYVFKNSDLLEQAFTRRSYSKEYGGENNEVLEFIGDKVLDFTVVRWLAETYGYMSEDFNDYNPYKDCNEFLSEYSEGKLTNIKNKLVCREMLARRIEILGLQYYLIMGKSDINQNVHENKSVKEDLFEAIIGAVAIDSNWNNEILMDVVELMLDPDYYLENGFDNEMNYVQLIQEWYQKKYQRLPVYQFPRWISWDLDIRKKENFSFQCNLAILPITTSYGFFRGLGHTKSEARMNAAKSAYEFLEENNLLYSLVDEVGEPDMDRAINQLQELYQKGYIDEPEYVFIEKYDNDGNPVWRCECHVKGVDKFFWNEYSSKKRGKKETAFAMLCYVIEQEENYET